MTGCWSQTTASMLSFCFPLGLQLCLLIFRLFYSFLSNLTFVDSRDLILLLNFSLLSIVIRISFLTHSLSHCFSAHYVCPYLGFLILWIHHHILPVHYCPRTVSISRLILCFGSVAFSFYINMVNQGNLIHLCKNDHFDINSLALLFG